MEAIFFDIHADLPRQGPGDPASTARAFSMLKGLPDQPHLLDVGCGPGAQTLDLARLSDGPITAVDKYEQFLDNLRERAARQGLTERIVVVQGDMFDLPFEAGSFDVIWSEGAIYLIGFEQGLRSWGRLLKSGGYVAVTEATWLRADAPGELRTFWEEAYPAMQDVEANLRIIEKTGYRLVGHFTLPPSAWWTDYYEPLERRLSLFEDRYRDNPDVMAVVEMERREIDLYRRYSDYYGYVFYVMQR